MTDVAVLCYFGTESAVIRKFDINRNYNNNNNTIEWAKDAKYGSALKDFIKKISQAKQSEQAVSKYDATSLLTRGTKMKNIDPVKFQVNSTEKETFKILHQLEFNSLRERFIQHDIYMDSMYDDYYGEEQNRSMFESNQKSLMVFTTNSDTVVQNSVYLYAFNHNEIPNLEAFAKLGFPLKQTVRVELTDGQQTKPPKSPAQDLEKVMSQNPKHLYRYETLPKMQRAEGHEEATKLLNEILQ